MRIGSSPVYLDTSALAKVYLPESGSGRLEEELRGRRDLFLSDLALTELASAVFRRVRQGDLPSEEGVRIYRRALGDLERGEYRRTELTREVHRAAEHLLLTLGQRAPLRAADALHLAQATACGARALLTFDRAMLAAARALGVFDLSGADGPG